MFIGSILVASAVVMFFSYMILKKNKNRRSTMVVFIIIGGLISIAGYNLATSYQVYDMVGYNKENNNELAEALSNYKKALDKNEEDVFAIKHIINLYVERGDYERALDYAEKLINVEEEAINFISKGNIEWELQLYDDAMGSYERAVELDEDTELGYYGIGMVNFSKQEYDKSKEAFLKYINKVGDDADAYYYLGTIEFIQNKFDQSIDYLDKVTNSGNQINMYIAYFLKGEIYYSKNQYNEAVINYSKSIEKNGEFADGYYNLARAYGKLRDHENSIYNLEKAIRLSDKFKNLATTDNAFNDLLASEDFLRIVQ